MSKRDVLIASAMGILSVMGAMNVKAETPSLKDAYANDFLIGTAFDFRKPDEFTAEELAMIKSQYNVITPENSMKPGSVHPQEDTWNWTQADALVEFCEANDIKIIGHTLVWHHQTAPWFFEGENGEPVTKEKALERMKTHIQTVVGRYKGKILGWDVVNEAIRDGKDLEGEGLRDSAWFKAVGPDYLVYAFKFAHEADPDAELYYNDYSIESGPKHDASLKLLKRLIDAGAPIDGVGIQGHWSLQYSPVEELDKAIENYKALGLKVMITEMDIAMTGGGGGQLENGRPVPRTTPATEEELKQQAEAYAKLFEVMRKHRDTVTRVTFWGVNDARSWRRGRHALIFDGENKPKPAFFSVIEAAKATTAAPAAE